MEEKIKTTAFEIKYLTYCGSNIEDNIQIKYIPCESKIALCFNKKDNKLKEEYIEPELLKIMGERFIEIYNEVIKLEQPD